MRLQAGPDQRGGRLDGFLARQLENLTRSQIQSLNRAGAIHVDGRQEKAGYKIRGGEAVEVNLNSVAASNHGPALLKPERIPLQIHYEDGHLAVIEKPAGLVCHPSPAAGAGT